MKLRRLARRALATSAAAAALLPTSARADDAAFGGGAFIGYHFGPASHLEWGVEGFATRILAGDGFCTNELRSGVGGFAQLSLLGLANPRLTLAAHAGGSKRAECSRSAASWAQRIASGKRAASAFTAA